MNQVAPELVARLRAGDPGSFEELLRQFGGKLLATATRILGNPEDAQDAVQDAMISIWKGVGKFEGASNLYTWMHRIVVNAALGRMKSARRKQEVSGDTGAGTVELAFEGIPSAWAEPGPSLEKRLAMRRAIQKALALVPPELSTVLILRDVEQLSSKEVADQLGIPDANVRQRLHRARVAIAELLRPGLCDGPELTCGGQLDLLMDYIDNALPLELQPPVHAHLESCAPCCALLKTYRMTVGIPRAIAELTDEPEPSEAFIQTVKGQLQESESATWVR